MIQKPDGRRDNAPPDHIQDGDTIQVRYLSVDSPYEGAVQVEPNLEDAYLCLLKNMDKVRN